MKRGILGSEDKFFPFHQTPGFANINESNITVCMGGKCEVGKLRHRALKLIHKGDPW